MARALLWMAAEEERMQNMAIIRRTHLRNSSDPFSLPDNEFRGHFRLPKTTIQNLLQEITPFLPNTQRTNAITPLTKLLTACNFYATGSYQRGVGAHHMLGMCQKSVSNCIRDVTVALNNEAIIRKYIHFPDTSAQREAVSMGFMEKFGFPGVLGCIDGTHVAMIRPNDEEQDYFNRKYYHSLNVLAICDSDLRIMHVDASYGGASHDSHVWNMSEIKHSMEELHRAGQAYWLLGDSGYAQRPWMMTPILNAEVNSPEEYYTNLHIQTRNVVERCFGVLKCRWRCLLFHRTLHYAPVKAGLIVNACTVLHNLMVNERCELDPILIADDRRRQPPRLALRPALNDDQHHEMLTERAALVQRLWARRGTIA